MEDPKDLGMGRASRLPPLTLLLSNLSLSEIWTDVGVASGPKASPASAFVTCANAREREKKKDSQLLFEEQFDDSGIYQ